MFIKQESLKLQFDAVHTEYLVAHYKSCFNIFLNEILHMTKFPDNTGHKQAKKEMAKMGLKKKEIIEACLSVQANFEKNEHIDCVEKLSYADATQQFLEHTGLLKKSKDIFRDDLIDNEEAIRKMIMAKSQDKLTELTISNNIQMSKKGINFIHREHSKGLKAYIF